jgi:hypothetical protein
MRSPALLASLVLAASFGCAGNYHDSYKAKNPDAFVGTPMRGASLHEVLASLYAPPIVATTLFVSKLDVLSLEDGQPRLMTKAEVDAAVAGEAAGDYGVVVLIRCLSEVDMQRYGGEKVAWYLLEGGKLTAWDQAEFLDRCLFRNEFLPARGELVATERLITAHRDANFPVSMAHTGEFYQKGLFYLGADRLDEAEAMLKAGDEFLDVGQRNKRHVDMENAPIQVKPTRESQLDQARQALVDGIARKKAKAEAAPAK